MGDARPKIGVAPLPVNNPHRLIAPPGARFNSPMSKSDEQAAREQRLAAKLRENLKRRKQQARLRQDGEAPALPPADGTGAQEGEA